MANSKSSDLYILIASVLTGLSSCALAVSHPKHIVFVLSSLGIPLISITRRELCILFAISLSIFMLLLLVLTRKKWTD